MQEYVNSVAKGTAVQNLANWQMFGGNPQRNGRGDGDTAYMQREWAVPTVESQQVLRDRLKIATDQLDASGQAILPGFHPITAVVTAPKDGRQVPIVVFRTYLGLTAYNMADRKIFWKTPMDASLERLIGSTSSVGAVTSWLDQFANAKRPNIIFENSTVGTLSSDGTLLFAIDDLNVPPFPQPGMDMEGRPGFNPGAGDDRLKDLTLHSKLRAYNLASGKLMWVQGDKADTKDKGDKELHDTYFLGPPLPLDGQLYVLTEKTAGAAAGLPSTRPTGKVLRAADAGDTRTTRCRRTRSAAPRRPIFAYGEGILVVPTNAGAVFGVDLLSNSLVWAYPYREKSDVEGPAPAHGEDRRLPPVRARGPVQQVAVNPNTYNHWQVTAPIIQDGKVVFTAPDAQSIHCVSLRDGTRLWTTTAQDDDLYLAGVFNGKVVIVSKKSIRALSLAERRADVELETGLPSGQGRRQRRHLLPAAQAVAVKTSEPEICAINVEKGLIHAHTRSRKRRCPAT